MTVNAEGDVHISDETIEGIGTGTFLRTLFGALLAFCPNPDAHRNGNSCEDQYTPKQEVRAESQRNLYHWDPGPSPQVTHEVDHQPTAVEEEIVVPHKVKLLTDLLPEPGYFVAGGIAGVVSRTATAPLDRLKVYLIAQVGVKDDAVRAVKSGAPVEAAKKATRPLLEATKQLWRMGGIRSMFAGKSSQALLRELLLMRLGNGLNVVKVMPESAIKFGSYEV